MGEQKLDKRKQKGELTRVKIVEAALELLMAHGKEGLTARALAQRAGVGKASLFHHFQNMNEIIVAALERMIAEFLNREVLVDYSSAQEMLQEIGLSAISQAAEFKEFTQGFFSIMGEIIKQPELKERIVSMLVGFMQALKANFRNFSQDRIEDKELEDIAFALTMLLDALNLYILIIDDQHKLEQMWRTISSILATYLEGDR